MNEAKIFAEKLARRYGLKIAYDKAIPDFDSTGIEGVSVFNWGEVIIFERNIRTPERFIEVVRHEIMGHFAIRKALTKLELKTICEHVADHHSGTNLYEAIRLQYGDNPANIGEEIMANIAEQEIKRDVWPSRMHPAYSTQWIKNFLLECHIVSDLRTHYDQSNIEFACCRKLG